MSDDDRLLVVQLEAINGRLDRNDTNIGKVFDGINDMRVVLERNTHIVDEHHRRSLSLEKMQIQVQKRVNASEREVSEIKNSLNGLVGRLGPVESHVKEVSGFVHFFFGLPRAAKFLTVIFSFLIGAYGVIAIIRDIWVSIRVNIT
jgi:hypothetical protein